MLCVFNVIICWHCKKNYAFARLGRFKTVENVKMCEEAKTSVRLLLFCLFALGRYPFVITHMLKQTQTETF